MTTSDLIFVGGGRERPLTVVRRHRVKGMRLTIDPRDASVRLSLGTRAPLRPALLWAAGKRDWIEAELAKMPIATPIRAGTAFSLAGEIVEVEWSVHFPRVPRIADGALRVGGPIEQMPVRVLRFLKRVALDILVEETRALAAAHGISVGKIGVGDPRSRWGSCSAAGDIRYSWRLVLAPDDVRRATVAHEVAHRVHMDHSVRFHALVARLHGSDPAPARRWLRTHGHALHWFGREG